MAQQVEAFREAYREEAGELLGELEGALLALEEAPDDADLVARAFRALHTIKGSGAMFGFEEIAAFTHEVETAFDEVRAGRRQVDRNLINAALQSRDVIQAMLAAPGAGDPSLAERAGAVVALLRGRPEGGEAPQPAAARPSASAEGAAGAPATYRVLFRPGPDCLRKGTDPLALLSEIRALGRCEVVAHTGRVPPLDALDPEACHLAWDAVVTTDRGIDALRDVFVFLDERDAQVRVDLVDDAGLGDDAAYKKLGEILVERGDLSADALAEVLASQKRIGDLLTDKGLVSEDAVHAAVVEQKIVREARAQREAAAPAEAATSVRVAADKLDNLVDLVGEMVIAQARLSQVVGSDGDATLLAVAEEIERLAAELRDSALDLRMMPIGTTFGRFKRVVRDLSAELGKQIDLVTEGAETELDKTVIERLTDPLVHLIRNSCDHGIEPPAARRQAGKPERGTVRLSAYHSGAHVFVEIRDDGRGLDAEVIRQKAVERGLLAPGARPPERELFQLIFLAGFSTAAKVSNVSGRGVGMDVVRRSIADLRGSVELESRPGEGTTVRVKLPLTLAIIDGLLVRAGVETFVLPVALVEGCVELTRDEVEQAHGNRLANVRGELVPYLRVREWMHDDGERPAIEKIVITTVEAGRFGFVVDEVIGQHQTVIKSLGKLYQGIEGLSGSTILGDGSVALILDVPKLAQAVAS